MHRRPLLWVGLACLAVMAVITIWAWIQIPSGAEIPTHFGPDGQPDAYGSKAFGLLLMPAVSAGILALLYAVPAIDPRRANLAQSGLAYNTIAIAVMVLMTGVDLVIVLYALGRPIDVGVLITVGVGLLFLIIGFALPRLKSSYLVGIRTPWTLTSEKSWRQTHILGAWLFGIFGAALIVSGLLLPTAVMPTVLFAGVAVVLVVPTVYSYVVWRSDPERASH